MTIEEITLICELPNYANFLDASYYLPYSPSVITKYVNNVENELGVKIFIRSNKSRDLQLTEEGKVVIEAMHRISEDWFYLRKQVTNLKDTDNKRIRIGSQPRFGNIHEQKIVSEYLFENPTAQVSMSKAPADDLIRELVSGKLDAAFITLNNVLNLDEYFSTHGDKILATPITSEHEMYVGISDGFFPGKNELKLKDLNDFTFAFPFPNDNDIQSAMATQSWKDIANEKGIDLKYINLQGYDSTVFQMARQKKFAVTTSHIPTAKYEGIKFLKIIDWTGGTTLYFLRRPTNTSQALKMLEKCVRTYKEKL